MRHMITKVSIATLCLASLAGGCDRRDASTDPQTAANPPRVGEASPAGAQDEEPIEGDQPVVASLATDAEIAGVRKLLLARHVEDLPSKETLDKHPAASSALRALAQDDAQMMVRARATQLLGNYPSPASEALVVQIIDNEELHSSLRAAGVLALGGWDLEARVDLRERVIAGLNSDKPGIAVAAAKALQGAPSAKTSLESVSKDAGTPPMVRRAVQESLATMQSG